MPIKIESVTVSRIVGLMLSLTLSFVALVALAPFSLASDSTEVNRFNVVIVTDSSGSMLGTDPENLRFEAISQFAGLLAEEGNYLGSVVFSDKAKATQDLAPANGVDAKNKVVESIKAVKADGSTNIGEALETAVTMIDEKGSKNLPSVILLLSDGNTDLPTNAAVEKSLNQKASAIAKAREQGIKVYSVCLNKNNSADISEMEQISSATNGVFKEVKQVEDLQEVFKAFYELIYGTSTIQLVDEEFPPNGVLETTFDIPKIGVEEVNIIIYGSATSYELLKPDGSEANVSVTKGNTYTMMKLTDVQPGKWTLRTKGVPGDAIRVNMVFNTNLGLEVSAKPEGDLLNPVDPLVVQARLTENGKVATDESQYKGYEANLIVMDTNEKTLETVPMPLKGDHFEVSKDFKEGNYLYKVEVTGNSMAKSSETFGPLVVSADASSEEQKANKAPVAVENPFEDSKMVIPFMSNSWDLDMATLATDDQKEPLEYSVVSSSLAEGKDYTVDGTTLEADNLDSFAMTSTYFFTVRATDKWGKSTDIDVVLKTHNVGTWAAVLILAGILLALAIFGFLLWRALQKPFGGKISCYSDIAGKRKGKTKIGGKGRVKLAAFGLDATGLDYRKSYFQASGDRYVTLKTDKPVTFQGRETKELQIKDGREYVVEVSPEANLRIRFVSSIKKSRYGRPKKKTSRSRR